MSERKPRAFRIPNRVSVKILLSDTIVICKMRNFSETGMFVDYSGDEATVNVGDKVEVQTLEFDDAPIVPAEVMRVAETGFAVKFLV